MADEIVIDGLGKLIRNLKQIDPELVADVKATHRDAATRVMTTAKTKVPVRTGRLEASLRVGVTTRSGTVKAGWKTRVPYAGPIHFGWPWRHIAPNPFMYAALDARRYELEQLYEERLADIVGKVH